MSTYRPDVSRDYAVTELGCWAWLGRMDKNGYGKAYDETRPRGSRVDWSHRVSYRRHKGEIPEGYEIDHVCQNTACINPGHLEAVTRAEHARRTMARLGKDDLHKAAAILRSHRLTYGEIARTLGYAGRESAHAAVRTAIEKGIVSADEIPAVRQLDESDREDIRALYSLGVPQTEIGAWYSVDSSQISRICSGFSSGQATKAKPEARAA